MAFKTNVQAQTPCPAITAVATFPNPQSGQYNYYGVKVSIAQGYGQNITVVGNFIDSENSAHTQQFTLTINAGELFAETDANVFQVSPTGGAEIEITSVTPCPTSPSNSNNAYDSIGKMHNIGLDYLINNGLTKSNFSSIWKSYTATMLDNHGYDGQQFQTNVSNDTSVNHFGEIGTSTFVSPEELLTRLKNNNEITQQQYDYLSLVYSALDNFNSHSTSDDENLRQTIEVIKTHESAAQNNMNSEDVVLVLSAASIARHSIYYWVIATQTETGWNAPLALNDMRFPQESMDYNNYKNTSGPSLDYSQSMFRFDYTHVGKADVAGGIAGAAATGIARFFGPIGWKVWAATTIGGAVGASVYETIMAIW